MAELTRQEFLEKYGDVEVTFFSYYKYTFTFTGETPDGHEISVGYGGHSDDIYRYEVFSGETGTVSSIDPYQGSVYKDGTLIDEFYDF